ncbi:MAG: 50S ribosomal protein L20 [Candidatus Magasanikbacteria bacterium RIFCSPHIGHO2_02_FULL_47_14]|uniref:Large ribosomal subunit protein bL20 n=1 Tax=Candidatus Magasanikbacteria bacterium RIFCSPHIGHO2_02_FULL_47_14 TaxID=1798680 RepID=A0A1F6M789_9BACT|nr:MAG: 50S ribosomal protein L20 [Candidatus Magasanikbacteria bacterium RIFCSPHIGHO2_02_FULL_47_14]
MPRVKRGQGHVKKRRSLMKRVKGFQGGRKNLLKQAKVAATKAGMYAYKDRRVKKRTFRALWEVQINAAARMRGMSYSKFIGALKIKQIGINRKILAELAIKNPQVFEAIISSVK